MKDIPISEFKKMLAKDIREGGSFRVTSDGAFLCLVVVPASAEKKYQIESIADAGNKALGKS